MQNISNKNKFLNLPFKGLLYLKENGVKKTNRKIISKIKEHYHNNSNIMAYDCEYQENIDFSKHEPKVKAIAFYLPQFHEIPENDKWWGKGFTEWTNTRKTKPRYNGHYQPREPHDDIGYYDLTDINTIKKQAELARQHNIYGFCFYHYWFSGKRLLEKPLDLLIEHPEIDLKFCICWANENWTRRWDGMENEILIKQNYRDEDHDLFINDLKKYIMDKRYIKFDGIPVILIYNPGHVPDIKKLLIKWRNLAKETGIGEIKILTCNACGHTAKSLNIEENIDGTIEFPPHHMPYLDNKSIFYTGKNIGVKAELYDYNELISEVKKQIITGTMTCNPNLVPSDNIPLYRTCTTGWDNSARKKNKWYSLAGFSLKSFYEWTSLLVKDSADKNNIIFMNAWNEWGEGTYLEPDRKYGYANINTFSKAICGLPYFGEKEKNKINNYLLKDDKVKICIHIHIYYLELIEEIIANLKIMPFSYHCYISTDTDKKADIIKNEIINKCKNIEKVTVECFENRGRDIAPFIEQMKKYINDYEFMLHLHTKKSITSDGYGDDWRKYLFNNLLGNSENIYNIFNEFIDYEKIGLIFPQTYYEVVSKIQWGTDINQGKKNVLKLLKKLGIKIHLDNDPVFPAGNMFWVRCKSVKKMFSSDLSINLFPDESNQKDMTLAHAIERSWVYISKSEGYYFKQINNVF